LAGGFICTLHAQVNPLKSQFFINSFLINPAQAGAGKTGMVSAGFVSQWNSIVGSPEILSFTLESPVDKRMGLGVSVINDKAGLLNRTVLTGSYSYKVPISLSSNLGFGLSVGYLDDNLIISDALTRNSATDPALTNYQYNHGNIIKAGFGGTFHTEHIEIQSSVFNINREQNKDLKSIDRPGVTTTVKYSFGDPGGTQISPLAGYRQIHGFTDYWDGGVNVSYLSVLDLSLLYHTNKSFTGGFCFEYEHKIKLAFLYNTEPAQIRGTTGGTMEVSLYVPFFSKNKPQPTSARTMGDN
jgi:type IX secretion system PorP/SprF family membrane protein